MTAKKRKTAPKPPATANNMNCLAKVALLPSTNAAVVVESYGQIFGAQDIHDLVEELRTKFEQVKTGDLSHCENMLVGQAQALQSIFVNLSRRAALNMGEHLVATESYMRLALKAQAQCTRTIEVLAAIKNPPVVFARQANIAHGHQQVNNGTPAPAHTGKIINPQNELLEGDHGSKTLDTRTTTATSGKDHAMATVEALNRR
jgi:hypothetical protein